MNPHFSNNPFSNRLSSSMPYNIHDLLPQVGWSTMSLSESDEAVECRDKPSSSIDRFVPETYETGYAYPLIVWLGETIEEARSGLDLMPRISDRNYIGMTHSMETECGDWGTFADNLDVHAEAVAEAICREQSDCNVHSERIYIAGSGRAANAAIQLFLRNPEWYAGAVALDAEFPKTHLRLSNFRDLPGKRLMIGIGARKPKEDLAAAIRSGRVLHSAGMDVMTRIYDPAPLEADRACRDINCWMMNGIYESKLV